MPLLVLLAACNDYDLQSKDTGAATPQADDSTPPADTADSAPDSPPPEDSGGVVDTQPEDTAPVATDPVYVSTGSALYGYDPKTNTATKVGDYSRGGSKVTDMTDIAIDLNGYMYGCAYTQLYRIDPTNAQTNPIATMDQSFNALTFLSDGSLVGAADNSVYYVDTSSGKTTPLAKNTKYSTSGDIVGLPDGKLYWTVEGGDDLVVVDPATGTATKVGTIGVANLFGVGYADGELYGFSSGGRAVTIDPASATVTANQPLAGSWWGATTNPVLW